MSLTSLQKLTLKIALILICTLSPQTSYSKGFCRWILSIFKVTPKLEVAKILGLPKYPHFTNEVSGSELIKRSLNYASALTTYPDSFSSLAEYRIHVITQLFNGISKYRKKHSDLSWNFKVIDDPKGTAFFYGGYIPH